MPTTTGLHLLADGTGIKMLGKGKWTTRKHGADYRRQWRKVHLGIDAATLEIRAMEVTDNSIDGAPMLANLLGQISLEEQLASVSALTMPFCRPASPSPSVIIAGFPRTRRTYHGSRTPQFPVGLAGRPDHPGS